MLPAAMSCSKPRPEFYLELHRVPCSSDSGCAVNKYLSYWMRICHIYHIGDGREDESKGLNDVGGGARSSRYDVGSWLCRPRTGFRIGVRALRKIMLPFSSYGIASRVSFGTVAPGLLPLKSVWTSSEGWRCSLLR